MQSLPTDATATTSITFTGAATAAGTPYTWTMVGTSGTTTGTGLWTPGQPIPSPPDPTSTASSSTWPACPRPATPSRWARTPVPGTNNGNALSLQRLGTLRLVGLTELADGTGGLSFTEAYIAALADVGVRAQGAVATAAISDARTQAEAARADRAGVNLDEEAARLIQYQQSYQAAAKVLQIAQQVFSQLLDIAG
jgi:flagellar hook-associated protein 1 FlgK